MGIYPMIYLTHETEQNVIDAEAQISANCGFPNGRGTDNWDIPGYKEDLEVFFIVKPPITGRGDGESTFTQEQMMTSVVDVVEREWEWD